MVEFDYRGFIIYLKVSKFVLPEGDCRKVWSVVLECDEGYEFFDWFDYNGFGKHMGNYFGESEEVFNKFKSYIDFIILYEVGDFEDEI